MDAQARITRQRPAMPGSARPGEAADVAARRAPMEGTEPTTAARAHRRSAFAGAAVARAGGPRREAGGRAEPIVIVDHGTLEGKTRSPECSW